MAQQRWKILNSFYGECKSSSLVLKHFSWTTVEYLWADEAAEPQPTMNTTCPTNCLLKLFLPSPAPSSYWKQEAMWKIESGFRFGIVLSCGLGSACVVWASFLPLYAKPFSRRRGSFVDDWSLLLLPETESSCQSSRDEGQCLWSLPSAHNQH